ncbi:MAG: T9SS type A sorting domain-containing protein, partial [Bacteroidetes bacterium]|nr:T9SS type A sorting domain-containing protein [Bacteroidota bacterium]
LVKHNAIVYFKAFPSLNHEVPAVGLVSDFKTFYAQNAEHELNLDVVKVKPSKKICDSDFGLEILVRNIGSKTMNGYLLEIETNDTTVEYESATKLGPFEHELLNLTNLPRPRNGHDEVTVSVKEVGGQTDPGKSNNVLYAQIANTQAKRPNNISENFEGGIFPPEDWTHNEHGYPNTWGLDNVIAKDGNFSIYNFNSGFIFDNTNARDELILPTVFSTGGTCLVSFDYAYNYISYTNPPATNFFDTLELSFSQDCGNTWEVFWIRGGKELATFPTPITNPASIEEGFINPAENNWRSITQAIPSPGNDGLLVKITYISGLGGTINIDNFSVSFMANTQNPNFNNLVNVYPNPAKSFLQIEIDELVLINRIEICNLQGQVVYNESINGRIQEKRIGLSHVNTGIYILRIIGNEEHVVKQIVIE